MLEILDPGHETRIVDRGRPRTRRLGVPIGGAADRSLFGLANALVGNPPETAGLEIAVRGPILRASGDLGVAVVGGEFQVQLGRLQSPSDRSFNLRAGDELIIGGARRGVRAYVCVPGGFDTPRVLDSRGSLAPLRAGTPLPCSASQTPPRRISPECPFLVEPDVWTLHVLPGGQRDLFAADALDDAVFTVHAASNRMGIRLDGPRLEAPEREMVSEPVCPGVIQVARDGQPIVLGVDGQTIGGYPKIAHVVDADLDILGRLRTGHRVRFAWIDFAAARELAEKRRALAAEWRTRVEISLAS